MRSPVPTYGPGSFQTTGTLRRVAAVADSTGSPGWGATADESNVPMTVQPQSATQRGKFGVGVALEDREQFVIFMPARKPDGTARTVEADTTIEADGRVYQPNSVGEPFQDGLLRVACRVVQ